MTPKQLTKITCTYLICMSFLIAIIGLQKAFEITMVYLLISIIFLTATYVDYLVVEMIKERKKK